MEGTKTECSDCFLPLSVFGSEKYNEMMWWDRSTIFKNFFESIGAALLMATNNFDLWLTCVDACLRIRWKRVSVKQEI